MKATKIPAIRGMIGDTVYYSANFSFLQINELVKDVDSELHTSTSLKEVIQRSLTDNYKKIRDYIVNREDHFFDSLVLAVYDGSPQWTEIRYELNGESYNNVGLLEFTGEEKIFPVDGQHRVVGIKHALKQKPEIASETINVMLIGHKNTPEGRERSRRIFSTLNRYVKPVRLGDIIALDEDDIVAIVTRDLLEGYSLFMEDRIKFSNSKSIPQSDKRAFTSLMTLYECHKELFITYINHKDGKSHSQSQIKDYLRLRPSDETIEEFKNELIEFWDSMRMSFHEMNVYINDNSKTSAESFRSNIDGGNLFFRPICLLPFVECIARIKNDDYAKPYRGILNHYTNLERTVSHKPWNHILWNPLTQTMIMRNQSLVRHLLINMYDDNLLLQKEKEEMTKKYATIFNIDLQEAERRISEITL